MRTECRAIFGLMLAFLLVVGIVPPASTVSASTRVGVDTEQPCQVNVRIPMAFWGDGASQALVRDWSYALTTFWNSQDLQFKDDCDVKFLIDARLVEAKQVFWWQEGDCPEGFHCIRVLKVKPEQEHVSYVKLSCFSDIVNASNRETPERCWDRDKHLTRSYKGEWDDRDSIWVVIHESSHLFGLKDDYNTTAPLCIPEDCVTRASSTPSRAPQELMDVVFAATGLTVSKSRVPTLTLFEPEVTGLQAVINGVTLPGAVGKVMSRISWDWGDGIVEDRWFPASHIYSKPGTYKVTATSYQSDGLLVTKSTTVRIQALAPTPTPRPTPSATSATTATPQKTITASLVATWGATDDGGEYFCPHSVAVDSSGNAYVTDQCNNRVLKFSADGRFLTKWGGMGSADGEFAEPRGIALDSAGNVLVVDGRNHRIQKFDRDGRLLGKWGGVGEKPGLFGFGGPFGIAVDRADRVYVTDTANNRVQVFSVDGEFIMSFGSRGIDPGQFYGATGIAIDKAGNVYVADAPLDIIQIFNSAGEFVRLLVPEPRKPRAGEREPQVQWFDNPMSIAIDDEGQVFVFSQVAGTSILPPEPDSRIQVFDSHGRLLTRWGSQGIAAGELLYPTGGAVDRFGNVFVADTGNRRIQVFSTEGQFLRKWGKETTLPGQFFGPGGMSVDRHGNVYVFDTYNYRVQKLTAKGEPVVQWGSHGSGSGEFRPENGKFLPTGLATDDAGHVYVVDIARVQKFDSSGKFIASKGSKEDPNPLFYVPTDVAVAPTGEVYVYDRYLKEVVILSSDLAHLRSFKVDAEGDSWGVYVDSTSNLYITDWKTHRVLVYDGLGILLRQWEAPGESERYPAYPTDIWIDESKGYVFITDLRNGWVLVFTTSGEFIGKWHVDGHGQLYGIAGNSQGAIYVSDSQNRILVYDVTVEK